ncbi:MAG: hypothetical protein JWQ19_3990 [Subtercola sp.]|nr:hypothetical protein [Subtercola sp.]
MLARPQQALQNDRLAQENAAVYAAGISWVIRRDVHHREGGDAGPPGRGDIPAQNPSAEPNVGNQQVEVVAAGKVGKSVLARGTFHDLIASLRKGINKLQAQQPFIFSNEDDQR